MWDLDHKESWALKNWCFWTVVLEKTLESPLDCKEIKPVNPKGNQYWIYIGRTDAEAEAPVLWLPDEKNWLLRRDPDVGKDWKQEKKGMTGNEKVGWHHGVHRYEFEWALGVGDGQGSLACCSPWRCKESDTTEQVNWPGLQVCCRACLSSLHEPVWDDPGCTISSIISVSDKRQRGRSVVNINPQ